MRGSLFGIYHPFHKACLLFSDLAFLIFSFSIATIVRLGSYPNFLSLEFFGLTFVIISCLFIGNGYTSSSLGARPKLPLNTFFIVVASAIPCTLLIYFFGPERFTELFGRGVFPVAILMFGTTAVLNRIILNRIFKTDSGDRTLIVLGGMNQKDKFDSAMDISVIEYAIFHTPSLTTELLHKYNIDAIVITPTHHPSIAEQKVLIDARLSGTPIFSLSDFFENFLFIVPVNEINNDWFIRAEGFTMLHSSVATRIKRTADILGSIILLALACPLIILTAIIIKTASRGPILFTQVRVGIRGENFTIYKFRTMRLDAEKAGIQWAKDNDERTIPFGKFFRKTRIDELPQCWNILRGEMSIIGPRPERPEFTSSLSDEIPYYDLRHVIKPGLTGWAQVSYPYGASVEDSLRKLQYDLYYIKNYSLLLDLNILLRTVLITLRREGR